MKNTVRKFLSLALAMIMVLGLAACGGDKSTSTNTSAPETNDNGTVINPGEKEEVKETDVVKKELIIGDPYYIATIDPSASSGLTHLMVQNLVGDTLTAWDPITNELVGELAESWEWVGDTTLRLHIRQGVKFHNGQDLKANDVAFSIDHVKKSVCAICYVWIDDTTIVDDYTIDLNLNDPAQDLIQEFAVSCFRILDEETCYEDPEEGYAVGTGPFILDSYEYSNFTKLVRFDDYWGEKPATEVITFKCMPEASSRLIALQNGEIDVCISPAASELVNVESDPNLKLYSTTGITLRYLALNLEGEKFQDERIRQAVAHAIDKEGIVAIAAEGHGTPAQTIIPDSVFGADKTVNPYEYNPDKAKALLEEAGAVGTPINILAYGDLQSLQGQVIQGALNAVGFNCTVERVESLVMWERIGACEYDAILYNWAGGMMGPDNTMRPLFHSAGGANACRMYDETFDQMLRDAMCEGDTTKRAELYSEVQRYLLAKAGPIPLYWDDVFVATSSDVHNFIINNGAFHEFAYVYVTE